MLQRDRFKFDKNVFKPRPNEIKRYFWFWLFPILKVNFWLFFLQTIQVAKLHNFCDFIEAKTIPPINLRFFIVQFKYLFGLKKTIAFSSILCVQIYSLLLKSCGEWNSSEKWIFLKLPILFTCEDFFDEQKSLSIEMDWIFFGDLIEILQNYQISP